MRSDRRQEDGEWSGDDHEEEYEDQHARPESEDLVTSQTRTEENEQNPDQQDPDHFGEVEDLLCSNPSVVGQDQSEDGGGQQPRLVRDQIRGCERHEGPGQTDQRQQRLGDEMESQRGDQQDRHDSARGEPTEDEHENLSDHRARLIGADLGRPQDHVERDHGQHRPDRVDEDALPLEEGTDGSLRPDAAQDRLDDRGAGDDENRSEQDGATEGQRREQHGPDSADDPRHERSDGDERPDDPLTSSHLPETKAQPTLEEDDAHRQ